MDYSRDEFPQVSRLTCCKFLTLPKIQHLLAQSRSSPQESRLTLHQTVDVLCV
jgi:hypothetical protein